jgi:hypothetical protein
MAQSSSLIQVSPASSQQRELTSRDFKSIRRSPLVTGSNLYSDTGLQNRSTVRSSSRASDSWDGWTESVYREGGSTCDIPQEEASDCDRGADGTYIDSFGKHRLVFTYIIPTWVGWRTIYKAINGATQGFTRIYNTVRVQNKANYNKS